MIRLPTGATYRAEICHIPWLASHKSTTK
ncbi:MAG: hypothetical protein ACHQIK_02255 [Candidatus Acidiferrales bacterium]